LGFNNFMKRTIPAVFAFVSTALIFSALVLAPSACGKKKDSVAERNNFLMTEGKTFLNSASYMLAEEEFQKVIDENLPAKAEARFAIALCETLHLVDTVSYFVDIFGSKTASATSSTPYSTWPPGFYRASRPPPTTSTR